ncbi:alpha/beta fold hydrolase [Pseudomonas sp. N040]|uniref:alpha/beta fold hydrolase n=1 Tax=Pseudomonas sp. N040 TaxID=2785325 RepID=UPI0018A30271|nr:alpha/beta fold hydrolase [Pseudomonas sp. N040]MBF7730608.1 alpha/beta fold hydrolase [Pseudomonas sp. N040]MBW7014251.1 alpha/beta hydrolase [Pseudomonas sp. N040]
MAYFRNDGCQLHYEEYGVGTPVVLLHGLGSSTRDWENQTSALAAQYQVILFDLRGHGRSDRPREDYSIEGFADDVLALLDHLQLPQVHLVGISMGGMVAFQLAVDHPQRLLSLTIVNSSPEVKVNSLASAMQLGKRWLFSRLLSMQSIGKMISQLLFPKPGQAAMRDQVVERWRLNDKHAYLASLDAIIGWGVRKRLPTIACPVLVVAADQDYTPVAQKAAYVAELHDARLQVIEDSRHATPIDQAQRFNAVLLEFLDNIPTKEQ